jgi:hypothetical protein
MKIDLKGIIEGAWNSVFVKDSIEQVHNERLKICMTCPHNSQSMKELMGYKSFRPDLHCTVCGCNLDMKTRCLACECPIKKWVAVASVEEEKQITDKLESDDKS